MEEVIVIIAECLESKIAIIAINDSRTRVSIEVQQVIAIIAIIILLCTVLAILC